MKKVSVNLEFRGTATVLVPEHLSESDQRVLANKLATAQILATFENPDCGECLDIACDEFIEETGKSEEDWDSSMVEDVSGTWQAIDYVLQLETLLEKIM